MGVPQGSILSVTLFIVKINIMSNCVRHGIDSSLFVDDFTIYYRSTSMITIERKINYLQLNDGQMRMVLSSLLQKTVCIHFCHRRGLHSNPFLPLYDATMPVVDETKFLRLIFDSKFNFISHLKYIKKCQKALYLLGTLMKSGFIDWRGDLTILLQLYQTLVR